MNEPPNLAGIPVQYQIYVVTGGVALKYLCEFYSSIRAGGGLRRILMSFWFGEQTPKVIADDYAPQLSTERPAVKPPAPTQETPPIKWL